MNELTAHEEELVGSLPQPLPPSGGWAGNPKPNLAAGTKLLVDLATFRAYQVPNGNLHLATPGPGPGHHRIFSPDGFTTVECRHAVLALAESYS